MCVVLGMSWLVGAKRGYDLISGLANAGALAGGAYGLSRVVRPRIAQGLRTRNYNPLRTGTATRRRVRSGLRIVTGKPRHT